MLTTPTCLDGVYNIQYTNFEDCRGSFTKTFNKNAFLQSNLDFDIRESFYSVSHKSVLRGMHFQLPPHDHAKLVHVIHGSILDVVVNIQRDSKDFGRVYSKILSSESKEALYISKGFAHGFLSLSDNTIVNYFTSAEHCPASDTGIHWGSFGFDWGVDSPIVSERDSSFDPLLEFDLI